MVSLAYQLITIAIVALQRGTVHKNSGSRQQWNMTYDYIVVGAGTSGAIVAARLTENPQTTVLLLEAGGPSTVVADMPAEAWNGMLGELDWGYFTTPQKNAGFAFKDHRIVYPRGRVLGGSSTTNFAIYNRGNRRDFDNWATEYGLPEWSFENVLPYFLISENNTNREYVSSNPSYHSTSGQMTISSAPNPDPILIKYMEAWNRQGVPYTDFNGPNQLGTTLIQQSITPNNWTRASTTNAFIIPALGRANLHVVTRAHVNRVLLRHNAQQQLEAYGVEFQRNNMNYSVYANTEVVLSAGATNTPQVLILSGIGPREHLQELGIPVQIDLPVGENLMDHILLPIDYLVTNQSLIQWSKNIQDLLTATNLYDYYVRNTGPITQLPVILTYHSSIVNDDPTWPDGIIATLTNQIGSNLDELTSLNVNRDQWIDYYKPLVNDQRHFYVFYAMYRPRSRGTVRLRSRNPLEAPLIDPNYFGDPHDLAVIVDTMSAGMEMTEQTYFRRFAQIYEKPIPGCSFCPDRPYYRCYSYLACVAQTITATSFHPTSTCRMGNSSEPNAVVDSHLRVRGVNGLRVVDASIMPKINNANTNAACMMIGERGADFIRRDNSRN